MQSTIVEQGVVPTSNKTVILGKVLFNAAHGEEEVYSVYHEDDGPASGVFYITRTCARIDFNLEVAGDEDYERLSREAGGLCGKTYNEMKAFLER